MKIDGTLAQRTRQLERGPTADRATSQQALRQRQKDPDLAGLRDAVLLAKLPADEQKEFTQLWADVAALLKKAREKRNDRPKRAAILGWHVVPRPVQR